MAVAEACKEEFDNNEWNWDKSDKEVEEYGNNGKQVKCEKIEYEMEKCEKEG